MTEQKYKRAKAHLKSQALNKILLVYNKNFKYNYCGYTTRMDTYAEERDSEVKSIVTNLKSELKDLKKRYNSFQLQSNKP